MGCKALPLQTPSALKCSQWRWKVALELLPEVVQQEVGEHFEALKADMKERGLTIESLGESLLLRQGLLSTLIEHPEAQLQLTRWGMPQVCLAVPDDEVVHWAREGHVSYGMYGRFIPASKRPAEAIHIAAVPKAQVGTVEVGCRAQRLEAAMTDALLKFPEAARLARTRISWLDSQQASQISSLGNFLMVQKFSGSSDGLEKT